MFSDELKKLVEIDALRETAVGDRRCLIHRDHRWTLILLLGRRNRGSSPGPATS